MEHRITIKRLTIIIATIVLMHFLLSLILVTICEKCDIKEGEDYETDLSYSELRHRIHSYNIKTIPNQLRSYNLNFFLYENIDTQRVDIISYDKKYIMSFLICNKNKSLKIRFINTCPVNVFKKIANDMTSFQINGSNISYKQNKELKEIFESTFEDKMLIPLHRSKIKGVLCYYCNCFKSIAIQEFCLIFFSLILFVITCWRN